jgi:hypothetical protein
MLPRSIPQATAYAGPLAGRRPCMRLCPPVRKAAAAVVSQFRCNRLSDKPIGELGRATFGMFVDHREQVLSDKDMRELAAYYAYLPRFSGPRFSGQTSATDLRSRIVSDGEPMRGIACGACHGELASKAGAPWLAGQPLITSRNAAAGLLPRPGGWRLLPIEQLFRRHQVGRIETFGEPVVHRPENHQGIGRTALIAQQTGKAYGGL